MKAKILVRKIKIYDLKEVEAFVREAVTLFGSSLFQKGQSVLLKPNLLRAASPERCVTTHPVVLEAVCRVFRDMGVGRIDIGDSPAMGSLEYTAIKAGYGKLQSRYDVGIVPFTDPVDIHIEENVAFLKIAGSLKNYDHIVNLPKIKFLIRNLKLCEAQQWLKEALLLDHEQKIRDLLTAALKERELGYLLSFGEPAD